LPARFAEGEKQDQKREKSWRKPKAGWNRRPAKQWRLPATRGEQTKSPELLSNPRPGSKPQCNPWPRFCRDVRRWLEIPSPGPARANSSWAYARVGGTSRHRSRPYHWHETRRPKAGSREEALRAGRHTPPHDFPERWKDRVLATYRLKIQNTAQQQLRKYNKSPRSPRAAK
jgi:hypothetical protein